MSFGTQTIDQSHKHCVHCGACIPLGARRCASCGGVQDGLSPESVPGEGDSFSRSRSSGETSRFDGGAMVMLQFLPSGTCVSLPLVRPVVLGYGACTSADEDAIDLTEFNAAQHEVGSRHCRLQRHETHLVLTDLGSVAGTRLNGEVLAAHDERIVRDGDRLVIGTLHAIITFNALQM